MAKEFMTIDDVVRAVNKWRATPAAQDLAKKIAAERTARVAEMVANLRTRQQ